MDGRIRAAFKKSDRKTPKKFDTPAMRFSYLRLNIEPIQKSAGDTFRTNGSPVKIGRGRAAVIVGKIRAKSHCLSGREGVRIGRKRRRLEPEDASEKSTLPFPRKGRTGRVAYAQVRADCPNRGAPDCQVKLSCFFRRAKIRLAIEKTV